MSWQGWVIALGALLGGVCGASLGARSVSPPPVRSAPLATPALSHEQTILVMAVDAKGDRGRRSLNGNTDSILLVHLNPARRKISVLSIPRDTRVPIEGHGRFKVNAANAYGGPELARRTVSSFIGVPIDRYMLLSLRGVRALVDAVGGVEVTVPKRLRYVDRAGGLHIDFQKGRQLLDGEQAEEYLRFRHDDQGDIGRVQRQHAFLVELSHQVLSPGHLLKLPAVWPILQAHARTDLTPLDMMRLLQQLKGIDPQRDLELTYLPGHEDSSSGPWFWIADLPAIEPFLQRNFRE